MSAARGLDRAPTRHAVAAGALIWLIQGCGPGQVFPDLVIQTDDGSMMVVTACAENVTVDIEIDGEVARIDVSGDSVDGDCDGSAFAPDQPILDGREVVVDGNQWVQMENDCGFIAFGPIDRRPLDSADCGRYLEAMAAMSER